ncbi:MAG: PilT/PilU family type 4a pilus ATPase [Clostridium sp.]|nr:PilT/PilU family type 4a pilus ATPase [Clostridium sp.]
MSELMQYLERVVQDGASDLFLVAGAPASEKLDGELHPIGTDKLMPVQTEKLLRQIYNLSGRVMEERLSGGDDDFSFSVSGFSRFRVSAYRQRGSYAAVIRVVPFEIPDWEGYGIPAQVMELAKLTAGLVLFTGTAGSGKSTTQACIVDRINRTRHCHVITLEDPIEYLHRNRLSIVSQREISVDTGDYLTALRASLRQAPDVIQLGEMRDLETIRTAITAAETGHLVFATLHTRGAVNSIDRVIDSFSPEQQNQIRLQLSTVLRTVVSQQLLPGTDGEMVSVFEVLHTNSAIRSMIRDSKNHQIPNAVAAGGAEGMISMDQALLELVRKGKITPETALHHADNPEQLKRRLS